MSTINLIGGGGIGTVSAGAVDLAHAQSMVPLSHSEASLPVEAVYLMVKHVGGVPHYNQKAHYAGLGVPERISALQRHSVPDYISLQQINAKGSFLDQHLVSSEQVSSHAHLMASVAQLKSTFQVVEEAQKMGRVIYGEIQVIKAG